MLEPVRAGDWIAQRVWQTNCLHHFYQVMLERAKYGRRMARLPGPIKRNWN